MAVKDQKGKVKLHQIYNLTGEGAVSGGKLLKTSLSHDDEARLQAVLNQSRQGA